MSAEERAEADVLLEAGHPSRPDREVLMAAHIDRIKATAEQRGAERVAAAVTAALDEVTDPIHANGCYYRHQQGETDECNSCAAYKVETAVRAALKDEERP